jgi:hypothetical protein
MDEMEDKKRVGMIATIAAVLLCGCPGLCGLVWGAVMAQGYGLQEYGFDVTGDPEAFTAFGIGAICVGVIGILITIGAGVYWLMQVRKAKESDSLEDVEIPKAI